MYKPRSSRGRNSKHVARSIRTGRYIVVRHTTKANSGGTLTMRSKSGGVVRGAIQIHLAAGPSHPLIRTHSSKSKVREKPWPQYPLFDSGDPTFAERVDEELAGFGRS